MVSSRENVNSAEYWNHRFGTGDWARLGGFHQTQWFAQAQVGHYGIDMTFAGSLCDFGCGAGDAFPVYSRAFPSATLIGVDFAADGIELAKQRYGKLAQFVCGDIAQVPVVDVIVCSNVIEHIEDDVALARQLLQRCARLLVVVPYRERDLISEHLRSYDEHSFDALSPLRYKIFTTRGWSEYGLELYWDIYAKNVPRALLRRPLRVRNRQILFEFRGSGSRTSGTAPTAGGFDDATPGQ